MNFKSLLIILSLLLLVSLTVNAENLMQNNPQANCKTMQEGICTEFYPENILNKEPPKMDMRSLNKKEQQDFCVDSFGFFPVEDSYETFSIWTGMYKKVTKVYVANIEQNSPASKAGLQEGDEITHINGTKVSKLRGSVNNYIESKQTINLKIKNKDEITIKKEKICQTMQVEPLFELYWIQVSPNYTASQLEYGSKMLNSAGNISHLYSPQLKRDHSKLEEEINKTKVLERQFRAGFNLCLANNYNKDDVNNCLNLLVNRFLYQIENKENLQMQQSAIQNQQRMQQYQIDALNNYSNALQNQRLQVDTNVYHSGTINNNVNIDGNINGTYYHYGY